KLETISNAPRLRRGIYHSIRSAHQKTTIDTSSCTTQRMKASIQTRPDSLVRLLWRAGVTIQTITQPHFLTSPFLSIFSIILALNNYYSHPSCSYPSLSLLN